MLKNTIQQAVDSMDPNEAAQQLAEAAQELFSVLGEEALRDFLAKLIEGEGRDKTLGLVHY
jgi:DNA phosphorothioation-dependent restriction protein DptG